MAVQLLQAQDAAPGYRLRPIEDLRACWTRVSGLPPEAVDAQAVPLAAELRPGDRVLLAGGLADWRTVALALVAADLGVDALVLDTFSPAVVECALDELAFTLSDWQPWQLQAVVDSAASMAQLSAGLRAQRQVWLGGARATRRLKTLLIDEYGIALFEHFSRRGWPGYFAIGPAAWRDQPDSVGAWQSGEAQAQELPVDWLVDATGRPPPGGIGRLVLPGCDSAAADLGYLAVDGQFCPIGRLDNALVVPHGVVASQEAELCLERHSRVAEAALIALSADQCAASGLPEGFFAVVQLVEGLPADAPLLELELLEYLQQRLSAIKVPHSVGFVEALPRLSRGRVDLAAAFSSAAGLPVSTGR